MTTPSDSLDPPPGEMVVIQLGTKIIKGYLDSPVGCSTEELLRNAALGSPESFRVRVLGSKSFTEISAKDIKAVFYVNSFDGDADHQHLNFHSHAPIVDGSGCGCNFSTAKSWKESSATRFVILWIQAFTCCLPTPIVITAWSMCAKAGLRTIEFSACANFRRRLRTEQNQITISRLLERE